MDRKLYRQAYPGTQGGSSRPQMLPVESGAFTHGLQGAQSGPVEESWPLSIERGFQGGLGGGLTLGGSVIGGGLGIGAGELAAGPPGAFVGGGLGATLGMTPGLSVIANSATPKPDDVWAHKLDQFIRRKWRGLD